MPARRPGVLTASTESASRRASVGPAVRRRHHERGDLRGLVAEGGGSETAVSTGRATPGVRLSPCASDVRRGR